MALQTHGGAEADGNLLTPKPFLSWPAVDHWLVQVTMPAQSRKRVLVLAGPSQTGKTEYVR